MKEFYCVKYLFLWYLKYTRRQTEDVKGEGEGRVESEMGGVVKKEGDRRRKRRRRRR